MIQFGSARTHQDYSLVGCGVYYTLWIYVIPHLRGYRIRQQVLVFEDGANSHKLIKVPVEELAAWDAHHDHVGRTLSQISSQELKDGGDQKA